MDALEGLMQQLKDVMAQIRDVEDSTAGRDTAGALSAQLDHLRARKEAIEEEINQATGAAR
ncbi:MAG: hypothetical protein ACAH27_15465 [Xanthobacteraceae bacterium]